MHTDASRTALFAELEQQLADKRSGTFFITTSNRRSICLGLTDGWITYCGSARVHGEAAIKLLARAAISSHAFAENNDYPFRVYDEVVHEFALEWLQPHLDRALQSSSRPPVETPTKIAGNEQVGVTTRIYRGQVITD
jgi:hypothetical protein